jgi:hypothetical protein
VARAATRARPDKAQMHPNFHFNTVQILWTLTFAAELVLLVVLLGRDRTKRYPWFTLGILLMALRLLASRLLSGRMPTMTLGAIFIVMAAISAIVGFLVIVEMARRAFAPVKRRTWAVWALVLGATACSMPALIRPFSEWQLQRVTWESPWALLGGLTCAWALAGLALGIANRRTGAFWAMGFALVIAASGLLVLAVVGSGMQSMWGPWPAWKTLTADSYIADLRLMQMGAQKFDMLIDLLTVELGLLVVLLGRRFGAGWHTHTQRIVIGLSTASVTQLAVQAIWQFIARSANPHSQAEYDRIVGLRDKLFNANGAIYVAVLIWWIACLWIDAPDTPAAVHAKAVQLQAEAEASKAAQRPGPD